VVRHHRMTNPAVLMFETLSGLVGLEPNLRVKRPIRPSQATCGCVLRGPLTRDFTFTPPRVVLHDLASIVARMLPGWRSLFPLWIRPVRGRMPVDSKGGRTQSDRHPRTPVDTVWGSTDQKSEFEPLGTLSKPRISDRSRIRPERRRAGDQFMNVSSGRKSV